MHNSVTPEQSIMLAMATLYIAMTEAITEILGKNIEPVVNHLIEEMMPLLPSDAADMCDYLLEFASSHDSSPPNTALFDFDRLSADATLH
jgi:hypothetical protein